MAGRVWSFGVDERGEADRGSDGHEQRYKIVRRRPPRPEHDEAKPGKGKEALSVGAQQEHEHEDCESPRLKERQHSLDGEGGARGLCEGLREIQPGKKHDGLGWDLEGVHETLQ
ncbi:MAG: hypothetical protein ACRDJ3_06300 [Solirubrobacteraceae bacterium]